MNIAQIEARLQNLVQCYTKEAFIYDFLLVYGFPKSTIARLKEGSHRLSKTKDQIIIKKKLLFQVVTDSDLHVTIDGLRKDKQTAKHSPRFLIVTDYLTFLSIDMKTQETLDIAFSKIVQHLDFFLPLAGMEKTKYQAENPADVKAAERMAKLFDEIKKDNPDETPQFIHGLNVFLTRLLFCFFAEDTDIFQKGQFTGAISSHTQSDGSDLKAYLTKLFDVLNIDSSKRKNLPAYLNAFPYVNGGLFKDKFSMPIFTRRSRQLIIESGELDWSAINPDIFGSMMQAVVTPEHRSGMGVHYTSVPNIMKVIEPLFLNDLYADFANAKGNPKKIEQLITRIRSIKVFDPACGSGNFLVIAYKELRKLEMRIFKEEQMLAFSRISLSQFYGIEIDDFSHEVAMLSLWLAEHQMNVTFFKEFGRARPPLPLKDSGRITCDNATRLNWEDVCPKNKGEEIYILGNPPYVGARNQSMLQKEDCECVFIGKEGHNSLDYIACWFLKGAEYLKGSLAQCAFVATNSICQGEQVSLLWPHILKLDLEIGFGHKSFKWTNNAKNKAAVTVVIVGLRAISDRMKVLFDNNISKQVRNISPYLTENENVIVVKQSKPIAPVPELVYGNQAIDGGNLIFNSAEKDRIIKKHSGAARFIRPIYGADDYLTGQSRWCIWINDKDLNQAVRITEFQDRIEKVRQYRSGHGEVARSLVHVPYRFRYVHEAQKCLLILPRHTTERRDYLAVGFLSAEAIVTDGVQVIYDPEIYILGILSTKIHMAWVKAVAGRIKMDLRYSNSLCYNSFPFPYLSKKQKEIISNHVYAVLKEREEHSEKTMAELYDPKKMPKGLLAAHEQLDAVVESYYRAKPFQNDEDRLAHLFKLYQKMITGNKGSNNEFNFDGSEET